MSWLPERSGSEPRATGSRPSHKRETLKTDTGRRRLYPFWHFSAATGLKTSAPIRQLETRARLAGSAHTHAKFLQENAGVLHLTAIRGNPRMVGMGEPDACIPIIDFDIKPTCPTISLWVENQDLILSGSRDRPWPETPRTRPCNKSHRAEPLWFGSVISDPCSFSFWKLTCRVRAGLDVREFLRWVAGSFPYCLKPRPFGKAQNRTSTHGPRSYTDPQRRSGDLSHVIIEPGTATRLLERAAASQFS